MLGCERLTGAALDMQRPALFNRRSQQVPVLGALATHPAFVDRVFVGRPLAPPVPTARCCLAAVNATPP